MERAPLGKHGSNIVWALPFFALLVFARSQCRAWWQLFATPVKLNDPGNFAMTGLALNDYSRDSGFAASVGGRSRTVSTIRLTNR
jgi:hypothetical protein